jgi:hypothetical protein
MRCGRQFTAHSRCRSDGYNGILSRVEKGDNEFTTVPQGVFRGIASSTRVLTAGPPLASRSRFRAADLTPLTVAAAARTRPTTQRSPLPARILPAQHVSRATPTDHPPAGLEGSSTSNAPPWRRARPAAHRARPDRAPRLGRRLRILLHRKSRISLYYKLQRYLLCLPIDRAVLEDGPHSAADGNRGPREQAVCKDLSRAGRFSRRCWRGCRLFHVGRHEV